MQGAALQIKRDPPWKTSYWYYRDKKMSPSSKLGQALRFGLAGLAYRGLLTGLGEAATKLQVIYVVHYVCFQHFVSGDR